MKWDKDQFRLLQHLVPRGGGVLVDTFAELDFLVAFYLQARSNRWHVWRVDFRDLEQVLGRLTGQTVNALYVTMPGAITTDFEVNRLHTIANQFRAHLVITQTALTQIMSTKAMSEKIVIPSDLVGLDSALFRSPGSNALREM
jgi:hypothetical protein